MTDISNSKASLGRAIHAIAGKWGWFVALGVGELIWGFIAFGLALRSRASRPSAQPAVV
ncbi:hypothetical protein GA0061098_1001292 [Bradyrhizobium shewense]|uniref:Uncharacterized protein n=1 Tax=Bradyrhizobium shewense TaxID=1761772 RepID=A0A1C3U343_9BRAD|nr:MULTISPECIES: hypothetical protein [Bradyrhizobium]SCB09891.1 hypothetical protein GA0061098_1001292 [Bradyrhizobium shewense]